MKTVTAEEMAVIDLNSEYLGVSRALLMENAGAAVCRTVVERAHGVEGKRILVLCGSGNNGGDGMAAARHLASLGAQITIILLSTPDKIKTEEARTNYKAVANMPLSIRLITVKSAEELEEHSNLFQEADVVIDAMLGTGVRGKLSDVFARAIKLSNETNALRVAVDVPTGLDPDTGAGDIIFEPHVIVTFHAYKPALHNMSEKVVLSSIGIPPEAEMLAGPGQLNMLRRKMEADNGPRGVLTYVYGEEDRGSAVRELLGRLPCSLHSCHFEDLIIDQRTRQTLLRSNAVLVAGDVEITSVAPFAPKSRPLIVTQPSPVEARACYVLWRGAHLQSIDKDHATRLKSQVEQLAQRLGSPVYVVGEVDAISNGEKTYLNWLGGSIEQESFTYVSAVAAGLIALSGEPLLALAATSYIMRSIAKETLGDPSALAVAVREKLGMS
ncbi:MAG: NAD(P)H-hydrate epimerase [Aigarchaeota archaeon]|nr:NAD(P)H-hydrate epimerase [Candidatus Pelearchaeum maunauluense]